ncbi:hypothetical protein QW180_19925 [Vibrio sinaloensis]|nr:hypothetical protein [Vibrio sinaloensis]
MESHRAQAVVLQRMLQKNQGEQFDWITKIQMYHGCRPSEACQLRVSDIKRGALPCIYFFPIAEKANI